MAQGGMQGFNNYLGTQADPNALWESYLPNVRRTPQETAAAALYNFQRGPGGLRNIAPGMVGRQRARAEQAANIYQLNAALGGYGRPEYGATDITFQGGAGGGRNVQDIIQQAVNQALSAGNLAGVQGSTSFRDMINRANMAFGSQDPESGQYSDIAQALGFTNAEDTAGAYGGFINRFLAPRVNQVRGPMRNMMAGQLDERSRNFFENPATQMADNVGPSEFLRYITQGF